MRYKAPKDSTGVDVGGEHFAVDKKGYITVPDEGDYSTLLAAAGYVAAPEPAPEGTGKSAT